MAALGASLLFAYWLPGALFRRPAGSAALIMILGTLSYYALPNMPEPLNPLHSPLIWELTAEFVVIVVLFATGLQFDKIPRWKTWQPSFRLLVIGMPLTIASVALLGWGWAGMTIAGAVTLGAVLAPTDPVLAGDVQIGPPNDGGEDPVRFTLTAEAGLNDGLAFPFVYLGLALASIGTDPTNWLTEWLLVDVVYRVSIGTIAGLGLGWLLGRMTFASAGMAPLADSGPGVIALASTFLCYGLVELVEGYGFLAVFFAGVMCRRVDANHAVHARMYAFAHSIEQALTAFLLFALGSVLPLLWPYVDWRYSTIGISLIFIIRPLAGLISLVGVKLPLMAKLAISFVGVRGIGSLFYLGYVSERMDFINKEQLWSLVAFTIFASTVIHGATAALLVRYATGEEQPPKISPSW